MPNVEIARELDVAEGTVRKHLERLLAGGLIHVTAVSHPALLSAATRVFIGVEADLPLIEHVAALATNQGRHHRQARHGDGRVGGALLSGLCHAGRDRYGRLRLDPGGRRAHRQSEPHLPTRPGGARALRGEIHHLCRPIRRWRR